MGQLDQLRAVAGLQLKLLLRKRVILGLVTLWMVRLIFVIELGRAGVGLPLLVPSLYITDLLTMAMACGLLADEAAHGTFAFVLAHGIERRTFLAGKLLPVVALAVLFSCLTHAATIAMLPARDGVGLGMAIARFFMASGMSFARVLVVAAITGCFAVLLANRLLAAMASVLYIYGLTYLVQSTLSPRSAGVWLAESLLPWRDSFDRVATGLFSDTTAIAAVLLTLLQPVFYAAVFAAIAIRVLDRRDLARGEP